MNGAVCKRILSILTAVLLLCAALGACSAKDDAQPAADNSLTPVKDDAGRITGYERRSYNDSGDVTRLDRYDAEQNYLSYVLYAYDDAGRLFTETNFSGSGIGQSRIVYTYDDDGRLTEKAYEQPHGETTVELYNADGIVTEKRWYGTDDQLLYREVLEEGAWVRYEPTDPSTAEDETE